MYKQENITNKQRSVGICACLSLCKLSTKRYELANEWNEEQIIIGFSFVFDTVRSRRNECGSYLFLNENLAFHVITFLESDFF